MTLNEQNVRAGWLAHVSDTLNTLDAGTGFQAPGKTETLWLADLRTNCDRTEFARH